MNKTTALYATLLFAAMSAGTARGGMVSYWAGEGNANDSVGPNSGTPVNGVTFGPGVVGQAFHFDGASYVQAGTAGLPIGSADRTLDVFFKVDTFATSESFLAGYGNFGSSNSTYALGLLSDGRVYFSQWGDALFGPSVEVGSWHNLGVTNVGGLATLYLDGVSVGAKNMNINTAINSSFYIGRIPGSLGDSRQIHGYVDEVKMFNTALSADQMKALASVPEPASAVLAAFGFAIVGLVAYSRLRRKHRLAFAREVLR
jgi:Concanavalin A-like lectin/glucanases superfamily